MKFNSFIKRAIVALVAGPLIILAVYKGGYYNLAFCVALALLSQLEFAQLVKGKNIYAQLPTMVLFVFIIQLGLFFRLDNAALPLVLPAVIITLIFELFRDRGSALFNVAVTVFSIVYYNLFIGFLVLIRELPRVVAIEYNVGGKWVTMVFLAVWVCDSMAYIVGSLIGKHQLWKRISPKKTIEGSVAGLLSTLLFTSIYHYYFLEHVGLIHALIIGLIIAVFSTMGDLFESLLKRDIQIKDSSHIIPGHGGILDRFDSMTMVLPVIYLYLRYLVF